MNNVLFSRERDNRIVNLISEGTLFSRSQIERIFFPNYKSAKRKAQERLCKLVEDKRIKRYQKDYAMPSLYYIDKKPINTEHYLLINEVYVSFLTQKKPWQIIEWKWSYGICDGLLRADSYINVWLEPDKRRRVVIFLEVEKNPNKRFDKDSQYEKVFERSWNKDLPEWVVTENNKAIFPTILIVTDYPLEINSKSGIRFIIASLSQIKEDVYKLIWR